jgi:hypothetical protein
MKIRDVEGDERKTLFKPRTRPYLAYCLPKELTRDKKTLVILSSNEVVNNLRLPTRSCLMYMERKNITIRGSFKNHLASSDRLRKDFIQSQLRILHVSLTTIHTKPNSNLDSIHNPPHLPHHGFAPTFTLAVPLLS